jgi:hypothetical protein
MVKVPDLTVDDPALSVLIIEVPNRRAFGIHVMVNVQKGYARMRGETGLSSF